MEAYLNLLRKIVDTGIYKPNRTGIGAYTIVGEKFEHNMADGFPLLTTKKMPFKCIASELEFFINGLTDKKWLQDRKNYIWDAWANPGLIGRYYSKDKIDMEFNRLMGIFQNEYANRYEQGQVPQRACQLADELMENFVGEQGKLCLKTEPTQELSRKLQVFAQHLERDLGPIYGWQWRHWGAQYYGYDANYAGEGTDQLENLIKTLETNPQDRRMIVSAWQPDDLYQMALPACHYGFQVTVIGDTLNLLWNQRSVDTVYGLPFNIASYGLLLHLLAKQAKMKEGKLIGFLADVHIYENQLDGVNEQLTRDSSKYNLPKVMTVPFSSIFNWKHTDTRLLDYQSYPKMDFGKVAV